MVINLWFSENFASMKYIRRKYNVIVNLTKFISNKKILSRVVAIGQTLPFPYHTIVVNIMRYTIRIVSRVKNFISYQHIIRYSVGILWIVSYHKIVRIVRYIDKWFKLVFFLLKFVLLFESYKLLDLF